MKKVKYVFVILLYKNISDLKECIKSIYSKVCSCQIIVVNSYFDHETMLQAQKVAEQNSADFLNVENKGYSYGNNKGIEMAIQKYDFEYVVVSNPDIIIEHFDDSELNCNFRYDIIAPQIITASGKMQNPMAVTENCFGQWLEYYGFKHNIKSFIYVGIIISKIVRSIYTHINKDRVYRIFAAHGSFVIMSRNSINLLSPVYDENVFLFAEEGILALKAKKVNIATCYYPKIKIWHKEDGSMSLSNLALNEELKKSNVYYYEKYVKQQLLP